MRRIWITLLALAALGVGGALATATAQAKSIIGFELEGNTRFGEEVKERVFEEDKVVEENTYWKEVGDWTEGHIAEANKGLNTKTFEGKANHYIGVTNIAGESCHSLGAEPGVVVTQPMTYELGWINQAAGQVGLEERPTSGSLVAQFVCGLDEEPMEIRGGVIGVVTPINKKVTELSDEVAATGAHQAVTHFEGSTTSVHREDLFMGGFWPSGLSDPGTFKIRGATIEVFANPKALEFVTKARASAKTVLIGKTANGLPLAKDAEIKATSTNLTFVTSAGNLECSNNVLTGTLETNEAATDKGKITEEQSTGEEAEGDCKTSTGLGRAKIEAKGFPWPTEFTTKGANTIKGTKKVTFKSTFPEAGNVECTYESAKLASTFVPGEAGERVPAEITTSNQVFKLSKKGSNAACPKEGELSGTFTATSGGETLETELS